MDFNTQEKLPNILIDILIALGGNDNARLAGGAVRDILLERPVNDYDIATRLPPKVVIYTLAKAFPDAMFYETGIEHGTITVVIGGFSTEITTLRKDVATDGRRATIEFADSFEEDARRRDFTVNAMYIGSNGRVYDYVGGLRDLNNKVLRFVGDAEERIIEDHLRILRYYRFLATLGFRAREKDLETCRDMKDLLENGKVSKERIWNELKKILSSSNIDIIDMMHKDGVLPKIIYGECRPVFDHYLSRLYSIAKGYIVFVEKELPLSREEMKWLREFHTAYHSSEEINYPNVARIAYKYGKTIAEEVIKADDGIDVGELLSFVKLLRIPSFPVSGEEVIARGFSGVEVGKIIEEMKKKWCHSIFTLSSERLLRQLENGQLFT